MKLAKLQPIQSVFLAIPLLGLSGFASADLPENQPKKPNIIFFIADDMTYDQFNCLPQGEGRNLTPNIDRLAAEGVLMNGQYVSSTVSSPSRYSCLTGTYAGRAVNSAFNARMKENDGQSVVEWNTKIVKGQQNLVEFLNEEGYYTGASGKNHVINVPGWKRVPLTADTAQRKVIRELERNNQKLKQAYLDAGFDFADGLWYDNPDYNGPLSLASHNMDWSAEHALNFLEKAKDSTFFLYFATTVPHGPEEAKRAWNADRRIIPYGTLKKAPNVLPAKETIPQRLKEAGLVKNNKIPNQKANMLWLDDVLGALIDKLEENGQLDNTIIVFFSDHGQDAKGTVYQDGVVSPSIFWKKGGFPVGNQTNTKVSNIDFAPTLLELAGAEVDKKAFDGKSFKKLLEGDTTEIHSSLYFEMGYSRGVLKDNFKYIALRYPEKVENYTLEERKELLDDWNHLLALRGKKPNNTDPTKAYGHVQLIPGGGDAEYKATLRYKSYTEKNQLYDLTKDPTEQNNLFGKPGYEKITKQLQGELISHLNDLPGTFGEFKTSK